MDAGARNETDAVKEEAHAVEWKIKTGLEQTTEWNQKLC